MKNKIIDSLKQIELKYSVKILYACESGSRAWGFESKDSDYDVRFIYVHKFEHYLSVDEKRDVIEEPIDDLLDICGWDIKKTLYLLKKSNPSLIEWFNSPTVYMEDKNFRNEFQVLLHKYYSPKTNFYHYLGMAKGNYRGYLKREMVRSKKYLYVLRPILSMMYIERFNDFAPMNFDVLKEMFVKDSSELEEINKLLSFKRAGKECDLMPKNTFLNTFIDREFSRLQESASNINENKVEYEAINNFFISQIKKSM